MKNIILLSIIFLISSCVHKKALDNYIEEKAKISNPVFTENPIFIKNTTTFFDDADIFGGTFHCEFSNSSFEDDLPNYSTKPNYWINCGDYAESATDIHGSRNKYFEVFQEPNDGNNFVGMVTRDIGTFEAIGQKLKKNLLAENTYSFSLFACRSEYYKSFSRTSMKKENFNNPVVLNVYGGSNCNNVQLLGTTEMIVHVDWIEYVFVFDVNEKIDFILMEAYYENTDSPYNGNILIDNVSPIYKISK